MSPHATALEIRPADLYPKADYAAVRKRLREPQKCPVTRKSDEEAATVRTYITAPVERIWTRQHDAHVMSYREWRENEPLGWLKMRCREVNVSYEDIVGTSQRRAISGPRGDLMAEVYSRYTNSFSAVGRLFRKEHSTVMTALAKRGIISLETGRNMMIKGRADEIKTMLDKGMYQYQIAEAVGMSQAAISILVKERGWCYEHPGKIVWTDDLVDRVRTLFYQGASLSEIERQVGHARASIAAYAKRMGWTRDNQFIP